jgi:hypothetical protein
MKKIITLFTISQFAFLGSQLSSAQTVSVPAPKQAPTYHELKEAGLLGNYTYEQLAEMQSREAALLPPMHTETEEMMAGETPVRTNGNPPPTIQTTSSAFGISPVNPSVCLNQSATLSASGFTTSSTGLTTADDQWSSIISLPFIFQFWGANYNNCIIGTNGCVGFNTGFANSYNTWPAGCLPNTFTNDLKSTIQFPWHDLFFNSGGTAEYTTVGVAPNRTWIIQYCGVHYYGCFSSAPIISGQVQLYEGSNNIEIHLWTKGICNSWNGGQATEGVENASGTVDYLAAGRTCNQWNAANEGYRWTWNNLSSTYTVSSIAFNPIAIDAPGAVQWFNASTSSLVGTGPTFSPSTATPGLQYYYAQITVNYCGGGSVIYTTAIDTVTVTNTLDAPNVTPLTICPNNSGTLIADCGAGCQWYTAAVGGTFLGSGNYTTPVLTTPGTYLYYVQYTSGACTSPRVADTLTVGATLPAPTAISSTVCDQTVSTQLFANCGANCFWYDSLYNLIGVGSPFNTIPPITHYYVQLSSAGCTSPYTPVTVSVGNLAVSLTTVGGCPTAASVLTTTASGASIVPVTVDNNAVSGNAPNATTCTDPNNADCVGHYITRTLLTPANTINPKGVASILSIHFVLTDQALGTRVAGEDVKVWLKSPQGTLLSLVGQRILQTSCATNTCYCPTFTPAGTNGTIGTLNTSVPYNATNYSPDAGALGGLLFGEDMYSTNSGPAGTWTLYVNDGIAGCNTAIRISDFSIVFGTRPPNVYSLLSASGCLDATLTNTTTANPTYTPPSLSQQNYNCQYVVEVTNGSCTGTATLSVGCTILPIELRNYTGKNTINGNVLEWTTATEINNDHFTIERSTNGIDFFELPYPLSPVRSKAINGNSTSNIYYSITDPNVKKGVYYYRLSQTDIDGTTKQEGTVAVTVKPDKEVLSVIPNPTTGKADIIYGCITDETAVLKLYDHTGSLIMMKEIACATGENKFSIDLSGSPSGIYLVSISTSDNLYKARLVKAN